MLKVTGLMLALTLAAPPTHAQRVEAPAVLTDSLSRPRHVAPDTVPVRPDWQYVKSYWRDGLAVASRPFHWRGGDFARASAVLGAATLSYFLLDQRVQEAAQRNRNDFTNAVSAFADPFGNGRYFWMAPAALVLHGQAFKNAKSTRVGLLILESQVLSGVVVQVLKFGLGRKRPYEGTSPHEWVGPSRSAFHSFPSGHSQAAFALATVLAMEFRHARAVPPIAYGVATLTALSRINANAHWTSDVLMGAALGHFITKTIVRRHPETGSDLRHAAVFVDPFGRPGLAWRF
jgi:hypothetical protein